MRSKAAGTLALIAAVAFIVLVASVQSLRPDLEPARTDLSVYAVGPHAALMQAGFLALGLAVAAVGWGWEGSPWSRLLTVAGLGGMTVVAFPTTAVDPVTPRDYAEVAASLVFFVGFAVGSGVLSLTTESAARRFLLIPLSFGFDAFFLAMLFSPEAIHGLMMRLAIVCLVSWVGVCGVTLLKSELTSRGSAPAPR